MMRWLWLLILATGCGPGGARVADRGDSDGPSGGDSDDTDGGGDTDTLDTDSGTTDTDLKTSGSDVLRFVGDVPSNLLFISIDTFRKDHLGAHGSLGLTPKFFDFVAEQGVVMDDHKQCSDWTYGSTTCTLAGRTNVERGHIPRLSPGNYGNTPVPDGTPFLATWLGQAGFYNIIACGNSWLSDRWQNTQGYDEEYSPFGGAHAVFDRGLDALRAAIDRGDVKDQWFLHLHFMEPHASYNPPDEFVVGIDKLEPWPDDLSNRDNHYYWRDRYNQLTPDEQALLEAHLRLLYEGEVRLIDHRMSVNWEELRDAGLLEDTLVVIWNDHGEQFWEHKLQTHAFMLFGEENDGFLMFWADNLLPGRHTGPTSAIDLVPTLLDLYDLDMPPEVTGYPIGSAPEGRPRFAEALARSGGVQSVSLDGYKLHFQWTGRMTFVDRNTDPGEQDDLYDPTDPKVLELWGHLRPMVEAMAPLVYEGNPAPNIPPELP